MVDPLPYQPLGARPQGLTREQRAFDEWSREEVNELNNQRGSVMTREEMQEGIRLARAIPGQVTTIVDGDQPGWYRFAIYSENGLHLGTSQQNFILSNEAIEEARSNSGMVWDAREPDIAAAAAVTADVLLQREGERQQRENTPMTEDTLQSILEAAHHEGRRVLASEPNAQGGVRFQIEGEMPGPVLAIEPALNDYVAALPRPGAPRLEVDPAVLQGDDRPTLNGQPQGPAEQPAADAPPQPAPAAVPFPAEGNARRYGYRTGDRTVPDASRAYIPQNNVGSLQQLLLDAGLPISRNPNVTTPDEKWGQVSDQSLERLAAQAQPRISMPINTAAPGVMDSLRAASQRMAQARSHEGNGHAVDSPAAEDVGQQAGNLTQEQRDQAASLRNDLRAELTEERANGYDVRIAEALIREHAPDANGIALGDGRLSVDERAATTRIANDLALTADGLAQLGEVVSQLRANNGPAMRADTDVQAEPMQIAATSTPIRANPRDIELI